MLPSQCYETQHTAKERKKKKKNFGDQSLLGVKHLNTKLPRFSLVILAGRTAPQLLWFEDIGQLVL